jgi:hypothetical protein
MELGDHQAQRELVGSVAAHNLPEAMRLWYDKWRDTRGFHAALFTANTVTCLNALDEQEVYCAAD